MFKQTSFQGDQFVQRTFNYFLAPTPHNRISLHHLNFKTISWTFITSPVARLYRFCYMLER